jgi:fused signal recognition particle receptor
MFGFLRRKKPVETVAAPGGDGADAQPQAPHRPVGSPPGGESCATPQPQDGPGPASPAGLDDEPRPPRAARGQEDGVSSDALPTTSPARTGFWSRFIPGSGGDAREPAGDAQAAPSDLQPSVVVQPAADLGPPPQPPRLDPWGLDEPLRSEDAKRPEPAPVLVPAEQPDRRPWMAKLRQGLSRTRTNLAGIFVGVRVDEALFEELETALLVSDAGVETSAWLLQALRDKVKRERLEEAAQVREALRQLLTDMMLPLEQPIDIDRSSPLVMMIAGVNGAGKTTSIGKLARHLRREGKTVLLAAGDTFRAAAREQLAEWGSRNEVEVIAQQGGDPAAVAFDAVSAGRARGVGVVLVDTAGRLPTQANLMQELGKIRRVIGKAMPDAPHEVLLVLDGNTGQNMLAQVKAFDDAVKLTGLVVTKLDGTAKGGALVALAHTRRDRRIPVYFIGVGEGIEDLQAFSAEEFAQALVG